MGWSIGFDENWQRDIGYGVPAVCDHPGCNKEIDRGLYYVCGGDAYGGEFGCGLYFCSEHLHYADFDDDCTQVCERCASGQKAFEPKPDVFRWVQWKLTDESWGEWRSDNRAEVVKMTTWAMVEFILDFKTKYNGLSPSYREIEETLGISSTSEVRRYLARLEADGRISFPLGSLSARAIAVPGYEFRKVEACAGGQATAVPGPERRQGPVFE